nr:MAG TPA: hypothetical protein [Caudoviricetes sp.]
MRIRQKSQPVIPMFVKSSFPHYPHSVEDKIQMRKAL